MGRIGVVWIVKLDGGIGAIVVVVTSVVDVTTVPSGMTFGDGANEEDAG